MHQYIYNGSDYAEMLRSFASYTGAETLRNEIRMPASVAQGYTRWAELPGGLSAMVSDCVYVNDFVMQRVPATGGFYVLQFDLVTVTEGGENRLVEEPEHPGTAMYFFRPDCGWRLHRRAGMRVRSVKVIITKEWLQAYIPGAGGLTGAFERRYSSGIFSARLPCRLQLLLENITALPDAHGGDAVYMQNRVLVLLELFFQQMQQFFTGGGAAGRLNSDYVARVERAAEQLALRVEGTPPALGELAAAAAMSRTSFKKYFRVVFGKPVYQYYLGLRLAHGRRLLRSGAYPLREVALRLGYSGVHHFSSAYIKEFGVHPSYEK